MTVQRHDNAQFANVNLRERMTRYTLLQRSQITDKAASDEEGKKYSAMITCVYCGKKYAARLSKHQANIGKTICLLSTDPLLPLNV